MLRKWICLVWTVSLMAVMGMDVNASGSIRLQSVPGGTIGISRVGVRTEDGIVLWDGLANWQIREAELHSENWVSWLAQKEFAGEIYCHVKNGEALFPDLTEGIYLVRQTAADQNGRLFEPFFLTIPEGENWDVYRVPKATCQGESPKTGDRPTPLVGAMGIGLSVAFLMVFVDEHRK